MLFAQRPYYHQKRKAVLERNNGQLVLFHSSDEAAHEFSPVQRQEYWPIAQWKKEKKKKELVNIVINS